MTSLDSFKSRKKLTVGAKTYHYFSLKAAEKHGLTGVSDLPFSMKILLENLLRFEDGRSVTKQDIEGVAAWLTNKGNEEREIAFRPARLSIRPPIARARSRFATLLPQTGPGSRTVR